MNNDRRKTLKAAEKALEDLQEQIEIQRQLIESCMDEEQDYYDNMPESFQYGEKGERAEEAVSSMQTALDEIDDLSNIFSDIYFAIEEACA